MKSHLFAIFREISRQLAYGNIVRQMVNVKSCVKPVSVCLYVCGL